MSTPFGIAAVIADPRAGDGRVGDELPALRHALTERGLEFTIALAADGDEASALTASALDDGVRYVVAVGDDATVQDVVNGMFRDGVPIVDEPVLGVVAANSGNDLVRSFGLPGDTVDATRHLLGDTTYALDLMRITYTDAAGETATRYAHNVAAVGLHAAATASAEGLPRWLGNGRRFLGFWGAYARHGVRDVLIRSDAKDVQVRAWSVIVGNGQFADGGLRMSPRSFPGDGVLDALVFTGPRSDAYRLLPRVFRHGDHVPDPNIHELRAKIRFAVSADRPMVVVADGERFGTTPVTFELVPQKILLKL
jgi:diacylglycerol kinase (ATP)